MLSPFEFRVFSTLPSLLDGGFGLFHHGMRSDLGCCPSFMLIIRLLTQHDLFFCSSYLVPLAKQGQLNYLLDALPVVLLLFPCAIAVIGFAGRMVLLIRGV